MVKKNNISLEKQKVFRRYHGFTLYVIYFILCISLWTTVMNNVNWKFNDIVFEVICLIIITICGMFGNVVNNFSLFHLRGIKITRERLISLLIGLFFPILFIIYVMVNNENFMEYVSNISLHDFITLFIYAIPIVALLSLVVYLGYIIIEPKRKRRRLPEYKEETEESLENYKCTAINLLIVSSLISTWVKIALNVQWKLDMITTEIVVGLVLLVMKVLANTQNKLPWYYSEKFKINKQFLLLVFLPYLFVGITCLVDDSFRLKLQLLGIQKIISLGFYFLPIFIIFSLIFYYIEKMINCGFKSSSKKSTNIILKESKRNENIIISLLLTLICLLLLFIYIIVNIVTLLTVELLLQIIVFLIPLGIIIYLVLYTSMNDINK